MKKALLIALIFCLQGLSSIAQQPCNTFDCAYQKAEQILKTSTAKDKYEKVLANLDDAENFAGNDRVKRDKIKALRKRAFEAIQKEKERADAQAELAKAEKERADKLAEEANKQTIKAREEKKSADSIAKDNIQKAIDLSIANSEAKNALLEIEKKQDINKRIIEGMNFYHGKFALSFKNGRFGFIDNLGNLVIPHRYKEATPFDKYTGVSFVKRNNLSFVVDTNSVEYQIYTTVVDTSIEAVNLSNIHKGPIPSALFEAKKLKYVWLTANEFYKIDQRINNLANVEVLVISNSSVSGINLLGPFSRLKQLNLSGNYLYELPDNLQAKAIRELNLSKNIFVGIPKCIHNLDSLLSLDLSNNVLKDVRPEIGQLPMLNYLDLFKNELKNFPEAVNNLSNLKYLNLGKNKIREVSSQINKLSNLEELNLSETELSALPENLEGLRNLKFLDLSANKFTAVPLSVRDLKALEELDISGNSLSELPEWLCSMPRLRDIYIDSSNRLSLKSCPEKLKIKK